MAYRARMRRVMKTGFKTPPIQVIKKMTEEAEEDRCPVKKEVTCQRMKLRTRTGDGIVRQVLISNVYTTGRVTRA